MAKRPKPPLTKTQQRGQIEAVLESVSTGVSVRKSCEAAGVKVTTLLTWITKDQSLREQYARARELQADALADEILDISDEAASSSEAVQRNKLRVDTRKWSAARLRPQVWGEKVSMDHKHTFTDETDDELRARIARLMEKATP